MANEGSEEKKSIWHNPTVAGVAGAVVTVLLTKLGDWSKDLAFGVPSQVLAVSDWLQQKAEISNATIVMMIGLLSFTTYMVFKIIQQGHRWRDLAFRERYRAGAAEQKGSNALQQSVDEPLARSLQTVSEPEAGDKITSPISLKGHDSWDTARSANAVVASLETYAKECASVAEGLSRLGDGLGAYRISKEYEVPLFVYPATDLVLLEASFARSLEELANLSVRADRQTQSMRDGGFSYLEWRNAVVAHCGLLGYEAWNFATTARDDYGLSASDRRKHAAMLEQLDRARIGVQDLPLAHRL